jgi:hypothetical protein
VVRSLGSALRLQENGLSKGVSTSNGVMLFLTGWLDGLNLIQTLPKASIRKKEYKPKVKHVN